MTIYLIRHGRTDGNEAGRYAGTTDYVLSSAGEAACRTASVPQVQKVYVSPMRRCLQTAELLFPAQQPVVMQGLREYNFGEFEDKTYEDLKDDPAYRAFIASSGKIAPPGGDDWKTFSRRCCEAFTAAVDDAVQQFPSAAVVAHGGVIMAIMERFGLPQQDAYAWQVENLGGWQVVLDTTRWAQTHAVESVTRLGGEVSDA